MALITPGTIAGYAVAAGFSGTGPKSSLVTAVAVAMGESGGRTDILGDTTIQTSEWGPSVGLWQIRSLKSQKGTGGERDADALSDPAFNARSAWKISEGGTNWQPWSVYTSGRYRLFLPVAQMAAVSPGRVGAEIGTSEAGSTIAEGISLAGDSVGTMTDGMGQVAATLQAAGAWLSDRQNWVRIAQVSAGVVLVVAGAALATRPLQKKVGQAAVSTVLPVGKIGKAVKNVGK